MFYTIRDYIYNNSRMIVYILIIILGIFLVAYIIQHIEFATVTGEPANFHHTEEYTTINKKKVCEIVNNKEICTESQEVTYHPATWSFDIFANDKNWSCSVDEYIYMEAVKNKWATAFCMTWNN